MLNTPFTPWPSYTQAEVDKVAEVLSSNKVNYWTGTEGKEFEREFANFAHSDYAIAVANGTVALDLAWMSLDIGKGDEVIVTARTYFATVSTIIKAGATPVFADICLDSQNITVDTVLPLINEKTKAICCVHLAGWPCNMEAFRALADAHNIALVEDCAQAHGAKINGKSVGSFGDISAWSFCQDKIMTTAGEGGMVTTNHHKHWRRMWEFKDHGKNWDAVNCKNNPPGFRWLHDSIGSNFRLPEIQSAVGRIQLTYMESWQKRRTEIANEILSAADSMTNVRVPRPPQMYTHAWYKVYIFVKPEQLKAGWTRDRIMNTIVENGVPCYTGTCPEVYQEKAISTLNLCPAQRLKNAQEIGETSLMFLAHPTLTDSEIEKTTVVLKSVLEQSQLTNRLLCCS